MDFTSAIDAISTYESSSILKLNTLKNTLTSIEAKAITHNADYPPEANILLSSNVSDTQVDELINYNISTAIDNAKLIDFLDTMQEQASNIITFADQAQNYVCVSLNAVSRLVDVYLSIFNEYFSTGLEEVLDELILIEEDILNTLNNENASSNHYEIKLYVDNAFIQAINKITKLKNAYDAAVTSINDSGDIIELIKDTLTVNTLAGLALAVSKSAWNNMKKMETLPYTFTESTEPETTSYILNDFLANYLENNNYYTDITDKPEFKRILKALPRFYDIEIDPLLDDPIDNKFTYQGNTFEISEQVIDYEAFDYDIDYYETYKNDFTVDNIIENTRLNTFADALVYYKKIYSITEEEAVTYYDNLTSPIISKDKFLEDFKALKSFCNEMLLITDVDVTGSETSIQDSSLYPKLLNTIKT